MSLEQMKPDEIDALYLRGKAVLSKILGVVGVGFGYKVIGGKMTPTLAFIVDVMQKKPLVELSPEEIVPKTFEGVPVDVQIVADSASTATCEILTQYTVLEGGACITNKIEDPGNPGTYETGTLGCFAILNNDASRDRYALICNQHVLVKHGGTTGTTVFQPLRYESGANVLIDINHWGPPVATILNNGGMFGNYNYTYTGRAAADYFVDAGAAKIKTAISSWCGTNSGIKFKNSIDGLAIGGSNAIADIAEVKASDLIPGPYSVHKVGRRTGKTTGHIVNINKSLTADGVPVTNAIEIHFDSATCAGVSVFQDFGDSGAVLVNNNRKVVGLMSQQDNGNATIAYACHIHPVIHFLQVQIVTETSLPDASSGIILDAQSLLVDPLDLLRSRLQHVSQGSFLLTRIERHREELVQLVNHCRPVTLAWQRGKGPAFMGHYLHALSHPDHQVPSAIDGITKAASMQTLLDALVHHGSPALQKDIKAHGHTLTEILGHGPTLETAISNIESHSPQSL